MKVSIMRSEFSPRDLQYNKIKSLYQKELMGPSLKEMEANKRIFLAQKNWKIVNQQIDLDNMQNARKKNFDDETKERDPLMFFEPDYTEKFIEG